MSQSGPLWLRCLLAALALLLLPAGAAAQAPDAKGPGLLQSEGLALANGFIEAVVSPQGSVVVGTTGGDPDRFGDEGLALLYGYPGGSTSGYASVRLVTAGIAQDHILSETPRAFGPSRAGDAVLSRWQIDGIEITQRISLAANPLTGRDDLCLWSYSLRNTALTARTVGLRLLLDPAIDEGDGEALYVPWEGRVLRERDYRGAAVPAFYQAHSATDYPADGLRAVGVLRGTDLTPPDRLSLATWFRSRGEGLGIYGTAWDYRVTPGAALGDGAVALWWEPRTLAPGQEVTLRTGYGLGVAPAYSVELQALAGGPCGDALRVRLTASNAAREPLDVVMATLDLPPELTLAEGQETGQLLAQLPAGEATTWEWLLLRRTGLAASVMLVGTVRVANAAAPQTAHLTLELPACPATPTPPPPVATPTPPLPPAPPVVPESSALLLLALGLAALGGWSACRR